MRVVSIHDSTMAPASDFIRTKSKATNEELARLIVLHYLLSTLTDQCSRWALELTNLFNNVGSCFHVRKTRKK
jgi:hypothetical protein